MRELEKVIKELYEKGYTLHEISKLLHYDYGYIRKLHMKILQDDKESKKSVKLDMKGGVNNYD